jgi:ABC-2 type transport system permease protein
MRNILVIAEREFKNYFTSPIAYVVLTIFILLSGFFFALILNGMAEQSSMRALQSAQSGQVPPPIDMPGEIARQFLGVTSSIMLFLFPMITMSLFSEEKKRGTIELLLTAPITDLQVVLGKFVAGSAFYVVLLLTTMVDMSFLYVYSKPATVPILTAYLGLLLYGLSVVAIGMFISTLTENQIVAAVISFAVMLLLWVVEPISKYVPEILKEPLSYLSVNSHLSDFMTGVLSTSHLIFYVSLIFVGVFLTYRSVDSMRWRG